MRRGQSLLAGVLILVAIGLADASLQAGDGLNSSKLDVARREVLAQFSPENLKACPAPNGWRLYLWPQGEARRVYCWASGGRVAMLELRGRTPVVVWSARVANAKLALRRLEANAFTGDLDGKPFNLLTDADEPFDFTLTKNSGDTLSNFFASNFLELRGQRSVVRSALSYYIYIGRWGCGWYRTWGEVQLNGNSRRSLVAGGCGGEPFTPWLGTPELFSKTPPMPAFEGEERTDR